MSFQGWKGNEDEGELEVLLRTRVFVDSHTL
jgi:hypothetical protein